MKMSNNPTDEKEPIYQVVFSLKYHDDEEISKKFIESMIKRLELIYNLKGKIWVTTIRRIQ